MTGLLWMCEIIENACSTRDTRLNYELSVPMNRANGRTVDNNLYVRVQEWRKR